MASNATLFVVLGLLFIFVLCSAICLIKIWALTKENTMWRLRCDKKMAMTQSSLLAMGSRVLMGEQALSNLTDQYRQLEPCNENYEQQSYSRARSLLDGGMSLEAVATSCDLSIAEVELMSRLRFQDDKPNHVFP